jgi:hypothetical protein
MLPSGPEAILFGLLAALAPVAPIRSSSETQRSRRPPIAGQIGGSGSAGQIEKMIRFQETSPLVMTGKSHHPFAINIEKIRNLGGGG